MELTCHNFVHLYIQSQLVEMEGEVARANSLLRQKEREVEQVSQVASKLTNERDNVADVVRQEFADRSVHGGKDCTKKCHIHRPLAL